MAAQIFEQTLGTHRLLAEIFSRLVVDQLVRVAVTRNFVAGRGDLLNKPWVALGNPAQHEKRTMDAAFRQQVEDHSGVALDAGLARRPGLSGDRRRKCGDLEVVFYIDRECIDDGAHDWSDG